jgi:hypothetical protein
LALRARCNVQEIIGEIFFDRTEPGSMGVVTDVRYIRCAWPVSDVPLNLFAAGSSGIEVQGPPAARNIIFPEGTVFLPVTVNDAQYGEANQYREADMITSNPFFLRTPAVKTREETRIVTREMEVAPGVFTQVTYNETVEVEYDGFDYEELTEAQARARV